MSKYAEQMAQAERLLARAVDILEPEEQTEESLNRAMAYLIASKAASQLAGADAQERANAIAEDANRIAMLEHIDRFNHSSEARMTGPITLNPEETAFLRKLRARYFSDAGPADARGGGDG